jgi:nicotinamidase-related amidase
MIRTQGLPIPYRKQRAISNILLTLRAGYGVGCLQQEEEVMTFKYLPDREVEVPEITYKESVILPGARTALIVVDMQNDFVEPKGSLVVPAAKDTIPGIKALLERARAAGVRIVYTQDSQVEDDPEFDIWPKHCVTGTWGWQIIDDLKPAKQDLVCVKNRYDGFYGTWLDHFLAHVWNIDHVAIVGTVSNICVLHTAASAGLRYYRIVVPADGISALTEFDQALTLRQVSNLYAGDVVKSVADIAFE